MRSLTRLLLLLIPVGLSPANCISQCNQTCPVPPAITVSASGTATAEADLAVVRVGYKLYGPDAKSAYASASSASNAIMESLTGAGIAKRAIESSSQVIGHTQPYELQMLGAQSAEYKEKQFTVVQSWTIRVKPEMAARTLNLAINAGANESGWIDWQVEDPSTLQARATANALENARRIAERSIQNAGVQLGGLISASETPAGPNSAMNLSMGGPMGGVVGGMLGGSPGSQPLAISTRRVEYNAAVYAVFAIK